MWQWLSQRIPIHINGSSSPTVEYTELYQLTKQLAPVRTSLKQRWWPPSQPRWKNKCLPHVPTTQALLTNWVVLSCLLFPPFLGPIAWMSGRQVQTMHLTVNLIFQFGVWYAPLRASNRGLRPQKKKTKIFWQNRKLQIFQSSRSLWSPRRHKNPQESGLHLLSWCFHFLAVAACAPDCVTQTNVAQQKTKPKQRNPQKNKTKQKASSLYFPWFSPWFSGIPCLLRFPPECPKALFSSARCVDSVTEAYPFICLSLCFFKQLANTSVLTEIATVIKHHQPHRFSLFVFFFTETRAKFGFGQAICILQATQNTNIILGFYSSQRCIQCMNFFLTGTVMWIQTNAPETSGVSQNLHKQREGFGIRSDCPF